jgi:hypothetical protein
MMKDDGIKNGLMEGWCDGRWCDGRMMSWKEGVIERWCDGRMV